ncbi:MAG: hypothetical protein KGN84_10425 [Acidobacteriota bacterium]|nr:hypothetical protein [Acidobacteriota bacterium]
MSKTNESRPLAIGLTVLSALGRLLPHFPNVTPVGGSCLFAGSKVPGWLAYVLPLAIMAATDPFVGGYTWSSIAVYFCFLVNVWIGRRMAVKVTPIRVGAAAFLCSLQFFVITVAASWLEGAALHSPFFTPGLAGLLKSYAEALPFWGRTLAGDLVFSGALFGMYELLVKSTSAAASTAEA